MTRTARRVAATAGVALTAFALWAFGEARGLWEPPGPREFALMAAMHARRGAAEKRLGELLDVGCAIERLPGFRAGRVPAFDSRWTRSQLEARLGRPATTNEANRLARVNALPYRIRTDPALVGRRRSSLAAGTPVFRTVGPPPAGSEVTGSLDADVRTDIDFVTPTTSPIPVPSPRAR